MLQTKFLSAGSSQKEALKYTCEKCGGEESVILRGLQDFLE